MPKPIKFIVTETVEFLTSQGGLDMKNKKAFVKLNGEIGEKEQSAIEFVDKNYLAKLEEQKKDLNVLLSNLRNGKKDAAQI
jgi:hypothetical protein